MTVGDSNFSDIPPEEKTQIEEELTIVEEVTFKEYPETSNQRPWWTIMLVGMALGVGITIGGMRLLSNRPQSKPEVVTPNHPLAPAMTVTLGLVEFTKVARNLNVTGTVAASELIPVLPQSNGLQVKQVLVKQGDSVKEGQTMAVLDDSLLQDQIRQA